MSSGLVMIMAGGTGGHIFPGLAVADALRERRRAVIWLGTRLGLEARLVPEHGIEIDWITIKGLRGKGLLAWLSMPVRALAATWQALRVLRRRRPAVVLGLGGFVSAPGGVAAWLLRKPLIIHEQNSIAGTTNRILARFARRVYSGFPGAFAGSQGERVIGNPVRRAIAELPMPGERFAHRHDTVSRLLVIGGSQGAKVLNEVVPAAVAALPASSRPAIRHQAGRSIEVADAAYRAASVSARVEEFIDDMAEAYAWADLVVARAGALTISELQAAGLGAVLVPYPYATDDHQAVNARNFCANGAGIVLSQASCTAPRLSDELARLLGSRDELLRMAEAARAQARSHAADELADACIELAEGAA